jgi:hypothetical protein
MGYGASMDVFEKKKSFFPLLEFKPLIVQPIA